MTLQVLWGMEKMAEVVAKAGAQVVIAANPKHVRLLSTKVHWPPHFRLAEPFGQRRFCEEFGKQTISVKN